MLTETTGIDKVRQGGRFRGAPKKGPPLHTIFGPLKDVPQLWGDIVSGACFCSRSGTRFRAAPWVGPGEGGVSWLLVILIQHLPDRLLSRAVWVGGELLCVLPGRVHILLNGSSQVW